MFFINMASNISVFTSTFAFINIRTLLLGLLTFLLLSWMVRTYRLKGKGLPPGPPNWPILGCLPMLLRAFLQGRSLFEVQQSFHKQYGPVCYIPLPLGTGVMMISGYKAVHYTITTENLTQRSPAFHLSDFHEILKGTGKFKRTVHYYFHRRVGAGGRIWGGSRFV